MQVNGFLDLARNLFCRLTEQIHELAGELREQLGLPHLKVRSSRPAIGSGPTGIAVWRPFRCKNEIAIANSGMTLIACLVLAY